MSNPPYTGEIGRTERGARFRWPSISRQYVKANLSRRQTRGQLNKAAWRERRGSPAQPPRATIEKGPSDWYRCCERLFDELVRVQTSFIWNRKCRYI